MTKEESERFNELCDGFSEMKSDIRNIVTSLAGNSEGAKGLVSQVNELSKQLSQHVIDDTHNFTLVKKEMGEVRDEQKKLKWWAGGIATAAGAIAWLLENYFNR